MKSVPRAVLRGLAVVLLLPSMARADERVRSAILTTAHFAFHSDFETNLNDALIAAGLARKGGKAELFRAGAEATCFDKQALSVRAAWDGAVDYYARVVSPGGFGDRPQFLIRTALAGFDEELNDDDARQFVGLARSFRSAAAPAYVACRWPAQDEKNRAWIEQLRPRLAAEETKIAARLEHLYGTQWSGLPIPVDVVEVVDWSGANSIFRTRGGGHLLIANSYQGVNALEVAFHEASHLLMGRGDPIPQALAAAAAAAKFRLPGDLWHVVLFYTTGEAVRRVLAEDGQGGYTPIVFEIFDRGAWAGYRAALDSNWAPYVAGRQTLAEAAAGLIQTLVKTAEPKPSDEKPKPPNPKR